jgi:hypothetical protein
VESIDEAEGVGLQPHAGTGQANSAARGCSQAGRFGVESRSQLADGSLINPVAALHVQTEQIRVDSLAHGDVVPHEGDSHLST